MKKEQQAKATITVLDALIASIVKSHAQMAIVDSDDVETCKKLGPLATVLLEDCDTKLDVGKSVRTKIKSMIDGW